MDIRASDADRERTVEALRDHTAAGRLDLDEFAERAAAVYAARTLNELAQTTADLPAEKRHPQIFSRATKTVKPMDVVTTDFFAFDDSTNNYKLQGLGSAVEMGDAVLGVLYWILT